MSEQNCQGTVEQRIKEEHQTYIYRQVILQILGILMGKGNKYLTNTYIHQYR